ncbi:MAG: hypothetical protein K0S07_1533 [Chlamydiales bacterium]|jgi:hypothetical protein|nr:hypothetical protein [Chlamydiales bacterium]
MLSDLQAFIKSNWDEYKRLVVNDPPRYIQPQEKIEAKARFEPVYEELLHCLTNKNLAKRPTFFVGPWGAGKTTHLKSFSRQQRERFQFISKSFVSIRNLDEALFYMTSFWEKCIGFFLLVVVAMLYDFLKLPTTVNFFTIFFYWMLFLVFTNKFKLFYASAKMVSNLLLYLIPTWQTKLPKVFIIEDLDRSSLLDFDKWALLSNLWFDQNVYIISFGYNNEKQLEEIYDWAHKLEGNMVFLPLDAEANFQIAQRFMPDLPFKQASEWFELLTPRQVIGDLLSIKKRRLLGEGKLIRQIRVIHTFWHALLDELQITEKGDIQFAIHIDEQSSYPVVTIDKATPMAQRASQQLTAFLQSIDPEFIAKIQPFEKMGGNFSLSYVWQGILDFRLDAQILALFKNVSEEAAFNPEVNDPNLQVGGS